MGNFARCLDFTKNLVLQIILGFQKTLFVDPMIMIYTEFVIVFKFFWTFQKLIYTNNFSDQQYLMKSCA